jgi:hypothetical protein
LNNSAVFVGENSTNFQYHKIGKEKRKKKKPLNSTEEDNYLEKGISQKAKEFLNDHTICSCMIWK